MKRKNGKKSRFAYGALALALALLLTIGMLPAVSVQAATESVDMRVSYELDGSGSIGQGRPFGATFYFALPDKMACRDLEFGDAILSVSSSGVVFSRKSFSFKADKEESEFLLSEVDIESTYYIDGMQNYSFYIPEKYMTNTGRSVATIKFTLTWKVNNDTYKATGQKTITECVVDEDASSEPVEEKSSLMVENYSVNKESLREGNTFDLAITVRNNGQKTCNNINVMLPTLDQITVNGRLNVQVISSLDPGATATVTFPMICAASMTTGNVSVPISVSSDEVTEKTTNAFVFVTGTAGDTTSSEPEEETPEMKPVVILESYDYGGQAVLGGKEFELTMNFKNTSRTQSIENAVIKVSAVTNDAGAGAAFTPANSSSTFYIESIGPGQTAQERITLLPKADAAPNSYSMQVSFDYVYGKDHTAANDTVTFSIPITQEDRFTVTLGEIYGPVMLGDSVYLYANYVNQGKSTIYNLSAELEGNFTALDGSSTYIGNVESGTGDYIDISVSPNEVGLMEGKLIFTYEDSTGAQQVKELTFTCDVMENMYIDPGYDPGMDPGMDPGFVEEPSFPVWGIVLIAAAGVGVVVLLVLVIRKKRRNKRMRLLEELEEDGGDEPVYVAAPPVPADAQADPLPAPGEPQPAPEEDEGAPRP